jgi:hypothetical protein
MITVRYRSVNWETGERPALRRRSATS